MARRIVVAALCLGTALACHPSFAETAEPRPTTSPATLPDRQEESVKADRAVPPQQSVDRMNLDYFKGYATDTGKIVTSPLRWEPKDWITFGMVLGGTGTLFMIDREVKDFAQRNHSSAASGFASVGNALGEPMVIFPAVGAFYLYGHLADDNKVRRTSLLALESLTISGAFTEGIKKLSGRPRPETGEAPDNWHGPGTDSRYVSFSSGHTANAFAVATVIANEYRDTPYAAPAAYGLATLTALSRIYSNKHWVSDTFFGAALGHFVSKAVLSYHKEDKSRQAHRLTLAPQVGREMTGLSVNYQF